MNLFRMNDGSGMKNLIFLFQDDNRPTMLIPPDQLDLELGPSLVGSIISMINHIISVVFRIDCIMPNPMPVLISLQHYGSPSLAKVSSFFILIWTFNFF